MKYNTFEEEIINGILMVGKLDDNEKIIREVHAYYKNKYGKIFANEWLADLSDKRYKFDKKAYLKFEKEKTASPTANIIYNKQDKELFVKVKWFNVPLLLKLPLYTNNTYTFDNNINQTENLKDHKKNDVKYSALLYRIFTLENFGLVASTATIIILSFLAFIYGPGFLVSSPLIILSGATSLGFLGSYLVYKLSINLMSKKQEYAENDTNTFDDIRKIINDIHHIKHESKLKIKNHYSDNTKDKLHNEKLTRFFHQSFKKHPNQFLELYKEKNSKIQNFLNNINEMEEKDIFEKFTLLEYDSYCQGAYWNLSFIYFQLKAVKQLHQICKTNRESKETLYKKMNEVKETLLVAERYLRGINSADNNDLILQMNDNLSNYEEFMNIVINTDHYSLNFAPPGYIEENNVGVDARFKIIDEILERERQYNEIDSPNKRVGINPTFVDYANIFDSKIHLTELGSRNDISSKDYSRIHRNIINIIHKVNLMISESNVYLSNFIFKQSSSTEIKNTKLTTLEKLEKLIKKQKNNALYSMDIKTDRDNEKVLCFFRDLKMSSEKGIIITESKYENEVLISKENLDMQVVKRNIHM